MANPFSKYVPGKYVSQYVGLPKEQFAKTLTAEQKAYDVSIAGMNQMTIAIENLDFLPGDEALRDNLKKGYAAATEEIYKSGRYQDAFYLVPKLATELVVGNQDVIKSLQSSNNAKKAQALAMQYGSDALVFNDPNKHKTININPETGEKTYNVFQVDTQREKNYDGEMQNIIGQMPVSGGYTFKTLKEGLAAGTTGKETSRGISAYTVRKYLPKAMNRYRGTSFYNQQMRKLMEIEGVKTKEEADAIIEQQMLDVGLKQVRGITDFQPYSAASLGLSSGSSKYDPSKVSEAPGVSDKKYPDNQTVKDLENKAQEAKDNGNDGLAKTLLNDIEEAKNSVLNDKERELYENRYKLGSITGNSEKDAEIKEILDIITKPETQRISKIDLAQSINAIGRNMFVDTPIDDIAQEFGREHFLGKNAMRNLNYRPIHDVRFNHKSKRRTDKVFTNRALPQINTLSEEFGLSPAETKKVTDYIKGNWDYYTSGGYAIEDKMNEAIQTAKSHVKEWQIVGAEALGHVNKILSNSDFTDFDIVSTSGKSKRNTRKFNNNYVDNPLDFFKGEKLYIGQITLTDDDGNLSFSMKDSKGNTYQVTPKKGINNTTPIIQAIGNEIGDPAFQRAMMEGYIYGDKDIPVTKDYEVIQVRNEDRNKYYVKPKESSSNSIFKDLYDIVRPEEHNKLLGDIFALTDLTEKEQNVILNNDEYLEKFLEQELFSNDLNTARQLAQLIQYYNE